MEKVLIRERERDQEPRQEGVEGLGGLAIEEVSWVTQTYVEPQLGRGNNDTQRSKSGKEPYRQRRRGDVGNSANTHPVSEEFITTPSAGGKRSKGKDGKGRGPELHIRGGKSLDLGQIATVSFILDPAMGPRNPDKPRREGPKPRDPGGPGRPGSKHPLSPALGGKHYGRQGTGKPLPKQSSITGPHMGRRDGNSRRPPQERERPSIRKSGK